jgi:hypothetical protein
VILSQVRTEEPIMFMKFDSVEELVRVANENGISLVPEDVVVHNGDLFLDGMNAEEWMDAMTSEE